VSDRQSSRERLPKAETDAIVSRYPEPRSALMPLLYAVQDRDGYVTREGIVEVAEIVGTTPAVAWGVCSFYSMYKREPVGRLLVSVCTNVACMVNGADELLEHLERRYADDPEVTVEEAECLAACDGAPMLQVNYEYHLRQTPEDAERLVEAYRQGEPTPRTISGSPRP
jgi:NADH-quinone oxidoreductase subunit E